MNMPDIVLLIQIVSLVLLMLSFFLHMDWAMTVAIVLLLLASVPHYNKRTKK